MFKDAGRTATAGGSYKLKPSDSELLGKLYIFAIEIVSLHLVLHLSDKWILGEIGRAI